MDTLHNQDTIFLTLKSGHLSNQDTFPRGVTVQGIYNACILCSTVKSFIELTRYLLGCDGVKFLLSERLSQDPLESFFGKQRMRGGYCDNPTVRGFLYGTSSLRVQSSSSMEPVRGNCRRGKKRSPIPVDNTPLPKRPRKASKSKK